ncbi:3',5'-cyclic-nucleotide phosphodiesterase [Vibrio nigripulchritudo]|uniref:DUF484 family protein n=1 Tax=Vibrio nigripulchritudo TaxID=28173 RepID=UPI00190D9A51|nr:DUF484 family protein [Vibrio nigripulchritudo]BCL71569.1 3',5'-cyclic-nucleotide phosphodiesterase [Vibrio nigripulchritudo]BDU32926.1 3',5'-cyclic-nucleotide phosphodiesterase [Vibrio nigripulchritudo]
MSYPEADALTAEIIAEYLLDNPDFFQHRADLVERLSIPHRQQGAVSLVEVQLNRHRQRIEELEEEITQLMSLAANNDRTFHEFMDLQQQVLQCDNLNQVAECIEEKARELGLKGWMKVFNAPDSERALSQEQYQRFATNHFNGKDAFLGRLKQTDRTLLFSEETVSELGSFAILPIIRNKPLGIIAFSSDDGGHFQPNMDTLFLRHLTLVVSHLVETLSWQNEESPHVQCTSSK